MAGDEGLEVDDAERAACFEEHLAILSGPGVPMPISHYTTYLIGDIKRTKFDRGILSRGHDVSYKPTWNGSLSSTEPQSKHAGPDGTL